jgi:hypothetical protein
MKRIAIVLALLVGFTMVFQRHSVPQTDCRITECGGGPDIGMNEHSDYWCLLHLDRICR